VGKEEAWARLQASGLTAMVGSVLLYELTACRQMRVEMSGASRESFRRAGIDPKDIDDSEPPGPGGAPQPSVLGPVPPVRSGADAQRLPRPGGSRGEGAALYNDDVSR
jgi:hypothetical protein